MGFSDASTMTKVGFLLSIITFLFDIIGFSTPYWIKFSSFHQGLFQSCVGSVCASYFGVYWKIAAQALSIMGFSSGLICVVIIGVFVLLKTNMDNLRQRACVLAFMAAGFIIIGAAVFAGKSTEVLRTDTLSWSFALTIVGGILYIPVGVVMLIE